MKTIRVVLSLILFFAVLAIPCRLLAASGCDGSGNCYVRAGATGSGNGANWTNAYTGFGTGAGQISPASMTRGVTYWLATGSYGAPNFNTADSGTTLITIEGVTSTSHGPASDWSSSYAGQALFGYQVNVSSDYWTFNGQAVSGCTYPSNNDSCYTMKFWNQNNSGQVGEINYGGNNLTWAYVEVEGTGMTGGAFPNNTTADKCNTDGCGIWDDDAFTNSGGNTIYVGYSYIHHTGNTPMQINCCNNTGLTFEYNWMAYNHTGQNQDHDEGFALTYSNVIIRYNVFQDITYNGVVADVSGGTPSLSNWYFYGNLVFWDSTYAAMNGKYGEAISNWGIIFMDGDTFTGTFAFYNNTIYGLWNSSGIDGTNAITGGANPYNHGTVNVYIENNLWYGTGLVNGQPDYCSSNASATCTRGYNAYYIGSVPGGDFSNPAESNDYTVSSASTDPFTNPTAYTVAGFELVTPDPFVSYPGVTLGSPYNLDMLGVTRSANGTWDRGALQINPASTSAPAPPQNLQVISISPQ